MPRAERPLDPDDGKLTSFAADLRTLRHKAGSPTYRELAKMAHYSSTTLADAASGRSLPSLTVTVAYVRACGGDPHEWEARWRALAAELSAARSGQGDAVSTDDGEVCPYVGLAAFGPDDADRFFGRERVTDDLVARVVAGRFVAVFGASGSGKSSLLRAGLLPRLRSGDVPGAERWPVVLFTPGPHPLEECAARVAALGAGQAAALHRELGHDPRALHLGVLQALAGTAGDADVLLVVDQFEEVFTLCADRRERTRFIEALLAAAQAANSRTRVVLGVRADFYPACSDHPDLVEALRDAQVLVGPMSTDELRRAVSLPASRTGGAVESGLLARVIADATGQAGVLPLVSHALRETWHRRRGNTLTLAGYEAAGGIQHALARTAEAAYSGMSARQQHLARGIFLRLVALGEGTEDTKRRVAPTDLDTGEETRQVLDALAAARLVTVDTGTVEITHEALLHAWPRLRSWINRNRAGLLLAQQLTEAATGWEREHRDHSLLYRGSRLAAAREWAERRPADDALLGGSVQEFLAASVRQERRGVRLRRAAVAGLAALTVLACTAAVIAFQQRSTAQEQRDRAVAEQVLTESDQVRDRDPSLAAQLTLAAYRIRPTQRAATGLLDTQNIPLSTPLAGHTGPVYAVAFSPDRHTLATGAGDNTIRLWDVTDPTRPAALGPPLTGHTNWVYWLEFSPDGHTLASVSRDRSIRLWNVTDRAHPAPWGAPLTGHGSYVFSVSFSGDGHTLATASFDRTVRLWDVRDPAHPAPLGSPLTGHTSSVASAAFSPDGRTVASAGHDRTIRLWNVTDRTNPAPWGAPLTGHTEDVYAVAFSPDSRTLASVSNDRTVRLWDVRDPAHPAPLGQPLTGHTDTILAVAFSHDGRTLATAGADHTIRLWDVHDPDHAAGLGPPLLGHTGIVNWVAFSPDDRTVASASDDHMVRLWALPSTVLSGHTGAVNAVAVSPDGRLLASAGADRTVRLWDVHDPAHPVESGPPLTGHALGVARVAFAPSDGHLLASAGADRMVRLWDVRDPARPAPLGSIPTGDAESAETLAFNHAGSVVAVGDTGHTVRLWDVRDPAHPAPLGEPLTGYISQVHWVGFSPDGRTLASVSSDDKVRLWDVRDAAHVSPLATIATGDTDGLRWGAFSPSGRVLVTAGSGHSVQLWDLRDPAHPAPLGQPLTGHTAPVNWVGFSPDGHSLVSTSTDRTVRLWDVTDPAHAAARGRPLAAGHTGAITSAAFVMGGRGLATASDDRTVELSTMDVGRAIQHICAATSNTLTAPLWRQYVTGFPFTPPCA